MGCLPTTQVVVVAISALVAKCGSIGQKTSNSGYCANAEIADKSFVQIDPVLVYTPPLFITAHDLNRNFKHASKFLTVDV